MTEAAFIQEVQDEITASGSLPVVLSEKEIQRLIKQASRWFYENYGYAVERHYYVIPLGSFNSDSFKKNRVLQLPECVVSVFEVKEISGIGKLGNMDKDFAIDRLLASEIFLSSFTGDDLVLRTAQMQFYDLTKAFFLSTIAYDWNKNTHKLSILGRDPKHNVFLDTYVHIPMDKLFDDIYFLRYVTAQAKISYSRVLGTYPFQLPGGVQIDASSIKGEGEQEIQEIKEKIDSENIPDWFLIFHVHPISILIVMYLILTFLGLI